MTKQEYKQARKIIRENGKYGLRWLTSKVSKKVAMEYTHFYHTICIAEDVLRERQDIVQVLVREGVPYTFRELKFTWRKI